MNTLRWLRVAPLIPMLTLPELVHAQAAPPASPLPPAPAAPDAGTGSTVFVVMALLGLFIIVGIGVKLYDRRRKREEEGVGLQARLSDVLLLDPALSGTPLVASVHMPMWGGSPPVVEVAGTVPSPEIKDIALHRIQQELGGRDAHVEDRIVVDPRMARRVA